MFSYFVLWDRILTRFVLESRARDPGVFGPDVNSHFTVGTLEALFGLKFRLLAWFLMGHRHIFLLIFIIGSLFTCLWHEQVSFSSYSFFSSSFRHFHFRLLLLYFLLFPLLLMLLSLFLSFLLSVVAFVIVWCYFPRLHTCSNTWMLRIPYFSHIHNSSCYAFRWLLCVHTSCRFCCLCYLGLMWMS